MTYRFAQPQPPHTAQNMRQRSRAASVDSLNVVPLELRARNSTFLPRVASKRDRKGPTRLSRQYRVPRFSRCTSKCSDMEMVSSLGAGSGRDICGFIVFPSEHCGKRNRTYADHARNEGILAHLFWSHAARFFFFGIGGCVDQAAMSVPMSQNVTELRHNLGVGTIRRMVNAPHSRAVCDSC